LSCIDVVDDRFETAYQKPIQSDGHSLDDFEGIQQPLSALLSQIKQTLMLTERLLNVQRHIL
jgi:hypothetical protein